ncbi:Zn-dependent alcohol dehydrogenase [Streptomyces ipomoeae]|jgi:S-(hydroxymethyl)glutathione dehydrogenase/alcohol dehydrogenase|uniref:Oxidoreductase, zinc-binding dehydrogenase family protein n=2 Tax=Streptomyces ipomoeae TaxID=103232 RepID=L1KHW3_9ACTN|nr:Zn-dependent alcohol dehydrogenase [Streptomyces ipomoeae]EKX60080.1 oxidoreductase, zinc-binding dehydrogenase family protein [Streptomyces ipomoeae 91-03]MDX2699952.1 Zn-dependent alcohol dehydrogenase [Streptomyces ipomoeae]MDX2827528.1 Zn-dependent alcohol dehydrogenase [Streptomyces ipomoeae]MDX2845585.1 Zn-dependent alcohol dehydrogenase [Streptomyces ipomoeae]MDX2880061.1 Zn-dependent alcohol dehydrogenase [Streptomyces ipomoeae]
MAVRAAVLPAIGAPLEIAEIELPEPGPGQVRVRLAAAGVCHSDLSLSDGTMRVPVPAVLGHEGAGTVVSVGEGVTHVSPGDGVVLNWAPSCGSCHACSLGEVWLCAKALLGSADVYARTADGRELYPGLNVAAFAEETVVRASCVLPAPEGIPLTDAALLGCAVLTGYGAVHNSARVREGETVAVFGVGGVGLATLQAARIAGASTIVAVDVSPEKEELARAAGATEYVVASENTAREIRALTGKQGVDVAVECVGRAVTIRTAWEATRRGGRTTVVGIGGKDQQVTFNALELFHWGRTLSGCVYGNSDPARDLPVLADHIRAGRLDLGALVTEHIALEGIPAAFDNMLAGKGGRALVVF